MTPQKGQHGREAARRRAAQAAAREEARRRQQRLRLVIAGVVAIVVLLAVVLVATGGGDDDDLETATTTSAPDDGTTTTAVGDVVDPEPIADEPVEGAAAFEFGTGECAPDRKPETRPESFDAPFASCLTEDAAYKAVIGTSEGTFTIDLLPKRAPGTVNNFVELARWGWFDGDDFHRVEPGFVIQGGDPVGDPPGTGGPGYQFADELPASVAEYTPGAVAMANSGPSSNGSQWFVCLDCSGLPGPSYSLFGWVSDGFDVVQAINAAADGEVTIVAVEILEDPLSGE